MKNSGCAQALIYNFQQRISWLSHRWRTQRNAISNVNCRIQWIIESLNAPCTLWHSEGYARLSVIVLSHSPIFSIGSGGLGRCCFTVAHLKCVSATPWLDIVRHDKYLCRRLTRGWPIGELCASNCLWTISWQLNLKSSRTTRWT